MPDENEIRIPSELVELYGLAKEAFVTYEQLTQRWEVILLPDSGTHSIT